MAESVQSTLSTHTKPSRRGGKFCVAGTVNGNSCKNTSYCKDVKMHYFPSNEEIRRKWVAFVRRHRRKWKPSSTSVLCSMHFEPTCYERRLDIAGIPSELQLKKNRLLRDSVPTIDAVERQTPKVSTARQRRQVGHSLFWFYSTPTLFVGLFVESSGARGLQDPSKVGHSRSEPKNNVGIWKICYRLSDVAIWIIITV